MCLAIPGKIYEIYEAEGLRMAGIDFAGVKRHACLEYVPAAIVGSYVLVHVGFAISQIDEQEAARTYRYLEELGQLGELDEIDLEQD